MAILQGFHGRVKIGDVSVPATHWQVRTSVEVDEVTRTDDPVTFGTVTNALLRRYIPSYADMDVTIDLFWDTDLQHFTEGSDTSVVAGSYIEADLYLDKYTPTACYLLDLLVIETLVEQEVRGLVKITVTAKQYGYSRLSFPTNPD